MYPKPLSGNLKVVNAIAVNQLPSAVTAYVRQHYNNARITEAGRLTDTGNLLCEAEVYGKDFVFDENGNFVKAEKIIELLLFPKQLFRSCRMAFILF